jgi:hypothetical protein
MQLLKTGGYSERLILGFTLVADLRLPCSAQRSMLDTPWSDALSN